jgi:hypothetical protein
MNKISNLTLRRGRLVLAALAVAGSSLASGAWAASAAPPGSAWLSLVTNGVANCAWTVTVTWAGFKGEQTLEVFVTQTYSGSPLVPAFLPIKSGKNGSATVTLAPLAPSTTGEMFYAWAQLLDSHGVAIPSSLDFASGNIEYCTAP